ncbi:MAG: hypothetical protein M1816_001990 [Peltula sp. TS41687]|nr:MAG: hypothetical protein M1816_001990 [Peltula sp. TS41687]
MATSTRTPSSSVTPAPSQEGCFDSLIDVDAFIDYDQLRSTSPSLSPLTTRVQTASAIANPNNTLLPPVPSVTTSFRQQQPQSFAGPSHQYDLHKQQTGLPLGALENTLAVNESTGFNFFRQSSFGSSMDDSFFASDPANDLMFGSCSGHQPSISAASDFDMDLDLSNTDPLPAFLFPEGFSSQSTDFVDPTTLDVQEDMTPSVAPTPVMARAWPGMHQQQAAMAKAQQQKRQASAVEQQAPPQPKPATASRGTTSKHSTNPIVEERISRLLSSMRQASVASSSEGASTPHPEHAIPHLGRSKKDEEEMDEDERLLASEEGKKLSSKERRQLRNKVSARAFRSRRKEYIGQLEAELAAKANEANALKQENRALMEENTRLSDLTRMLLSSPAFSTFLDTLGASELSTAAATETAGRSSESTNATTIPPTIKKDPNPHFMAEEQLQTPQTNNPQIGMTLIPEHPIDFSTLDANPSTWGLGNLPAGFWGNTRPQVFTVTEIPAGPPVDIIDTDILSGKSSFVPSGSPSILDEAKSDIPRVESMPVLGGFVQQSSEKAPTGVGEPAESDPAFSLFDDAPLTTGSTVTRPSSGCGPQGIKGFEGVKSEKKLDVNVTSEADQPHEDSDTARIERFRRLCRSAEAAYERISRITSHL